MTMATCKWCGEPFTPGAWPEHCSENCLLSDTEQTWDPERRARLQDAFDRWHEEQK